MKVGICLPSPLRDLMISQNHEEERTQGVFDFRFFTRSHALIRVPQTNPGVIPSNLSDFADF